MKNGQYEIRIKRIYDAPEPEDGYRVLVDRLWPRGIRRDEGRFETWHKEIAPSPDLRKQFAHRTEKFAWFRERYLLELDGNGGRESFLNDCRENLKTRNVTLLYGAREPLCNQAAVLKEWLAANGCGGRLSGGKSVSP